MRRQHDQGTFQDFITHIDLNDPSAQRSVLDFLVKNEVHVLVANAGGYLHSRLCSQAALHQLKVGRHFVCESTTYYLVRPDATWPQVTCCPQVHRIALGSDRVLLASAPELLAPFHDLRRRGPAG